MFLPFFPFSPQGFEPRKSQKRHNVDQRLAQSGWRDSYRRGWKQSRSTRTSGQGKQSGRIQSEIGRIGSMWLVGLAREENKFC